MVTFLGGLTVATWSRMWLHSLFAWVRILALLVPGWGDPGSLSSPQESGHDDKWLFWIVPLETLVTAEGSSSTFYFGLNEETILRGG